MATEKKSKKVKLKAFTKEIGLHDVVNNFLKEKGLDGIEIQSMKFNITHDIVQDQDCNTLVCQPPKTKVQIDAGNGRTLCRCVNLHP